MLTFKNSVCYKVDPVQMAVLLLRMIAIYRAKKMTLSSRRPAFVRWTTNQTRQLQPSSNLKAAKKWALGLGTMSLFV